MGEEHRYGSVLAGQVAIVTGAASGIGRSSALALASAGAAVLVADLDLDGAGQVVAEIADCGGHAAPALVDVSDAAQVEAMVQHCVELFGGVDVLCNNAALLSPDSRSRDTDVVDLDLDVWERTMAVNLRGPMLGCRFAIPEMRQRNGGSIVNLSSGAAEQADFVRCAYGTSKGGVNSLTRYVAAAFGKDGIRCNAISPGFVLTPAVRALWTAEALDGFVAHLMAPELGQPEDVADLVVFLASDHSAYMTGQILTVDGGLSGHLPMYANTVRQRAARSAG